MKIASRLKSLVKNKKFIYSIVRKIFDIYNFIYLKYFAGSNKDIFTDIYTKNKWKDIYSFSGTGSNLEQTKTILNELPKLFVKYKIKSILDIPCGDFYWMKEFKFKDIKYLGGDIVPELVIKNNKKFSKKNIKFKILDLTSDSLPYADLIFCRDCLVHLSYKDIFKSLNIIRKSNCKYFMTTNFLERISNKDIATGSWRTINLCKPPFNFSEPIENLYENCTEVNNSYKDKVLSIWEVKSIPFIE